MADNRRKWIAPKPCSAIVIMICLLVCSYEVTWLTSRYLTYSTNKEVSIEMTDVVHVPVVSLCIPANWSRGGNITDFMKQFIHPEKTVLRKSYFNLPADPNTQFRHFFFSGNKCINIAMYAGTMVGRNIFLLTRTNIFFMISINMYTETSDSLSFRLLPSIDSLIDSSESANEVRVGIYYEKRGNDIIRTKNHYAACINYQWFETHLLPRPYDTDCEAYENSSNRSRTRCFEECIKKRSTELFSLLPQGVHIFYPETVAYPIANSSFSKQPEYLQLKKSCQDQCRKADCYQQLFQATSECVIVKNDSFLAVVALHFPTQPDIIVTTRATMSLSELFFMIFFSICFWTVSPVDLAKSDVSPLLEYFAQNQRRIQVSALVIKWFIYGWCIVGFCWQLTQLSIQYFGYETSTIISISIENPQQVPALAVCHYTNISSHLANKNTSTTLRQAFDSASWRIISSSNDVIKRKERFWKTNLFCESFNPISEKNINQQPF